MPFSPHRSGPRVVAAASDRRYAPQSIAAIATVLIGVAIVAPFTVHAQAALSARTVLESGGGPLCAVGVSSDVSLKRPGAEVSLVTTPVTEGLRDRVPRPLLAFDLARSFDHSWQLRASGVVGASASRCPAQSQWSRGWVQLARAIPNGGVSIGVGARSLSTLDPSRDRAGVTFALWQHRGTARFGVDVRTFLTQSERMSRFTYTAQRPDSFPNDTAQGGWVRFTRPVQAADSAITSQRAQAIALRTRWQRQLGRAALDVSAGAISDLQGTSNAVEPTDSSARLPRDGRWSRIHPWVRLDARVRVRSWADLLLGLAALPNLSDQQAPTFAASRNARGSASRVVSIGLSITAGAREPVLTDTSTDNNERSSGTAVSAARVTFEARRVDSADAAADSLDGRVSVVLRLRDPGARVVEVSGEPFGWRAIPLLRAGDDWWEARVRMFPGTWRMSVRRDGRRWTAPPGLPVLHDEFGGEVGLVTVR